MLSVISTVISIVLSIVAIIYTFVEGKRSSVLHSKITKNIEEIRSLQNQVVKDIKKEQALLKQIRLVKPYIQKLRQEDLYKGLSDRSKEVVDGLQAYFDQYAVGTEDPAEQSGEA